ncbi:DUF543-domain-containing protein [Ramicandelaber brevisporus]|nr:DUF543-domain-containing protein [Ramicandelaber brevisporus]
MSSQQTETLASRNWDRCAANTIVKAGAGLGAGIVLSVVLFRRRMWPVHMGFGFGLGTGYAQCNQTFSPVSNIGVRVSNVYPADSTKSSSSAQ